MKMHRNIFKNVLIMHIGNRAFSRVIVKKDTANVATVDSQKMDATFQ